MKKKGNKQRERHSPALELHSGAGNGKRIFVFSPAHVYKEERIHR